ncbi:MAG: cysteine dioxygenase family protein [Pseudanabaenales cyanobacterium]|nr:cysteine dioxygenase family protein [Pseudanabaenales cyanobacterium]
MIQVISIHPSDNLNPNLPDSLQHLILTLKSQPQLTPAGVRQCVMDAQIPPEDLLPWADFNHPPTDSYGRKQIYRDEGLEVMVMSWAPGDYSAIHDHGATQWGAVQFLGHVDHYSYTLNDGILQTQARVHFKPGDVAAVDHDLIHQMGNPGPGPCLSLHVYGCNTPQANITGNARIFDLFEGCIQKTDGGVFFSLPDHLINQRQMGLKGDEETTLRHHYQMRDRLHKIVLAQAETSPLLQGKIADLEEQILQLESKLRVST